MSSAKKLKKKKKKDFKTVKNIFETSNHSLLGWITRNVFVSIYVRLRRSVVRMCLAAMSSSLRR